MYNLVGDINFDDSLIPESEAGYLKAIAAAKSVYGNTDARVANMYVELANKYYDIKGQYWAKDKTELAYKIMQVNYPPEHVQVLTLESQLAKYDVAQYKYNNGEEKFKSLLFRLKTSEDVQARKLYTIVFSHLVSLYKKTKRMELVESFWSELLSLAREDGEAEIVIKFDPDLEKVHAFDSKDGGFVKIEFSVTKEGTAKDVNLVSNDGSVFFANTAIEAVKQWQ